MGTSLSVAAAAWLAACLFAFSAPSMGQDNRAAADQAAQKIASTVCAACHGPAGVSTSPVFPRLAGQSEIYLVAQLKAFKGKARSEQDAHDYMWGMATLLEDSVIADMSRYYASQKPAPGIPGDPKLTERGKVLFEKGDSARSVVACASCHGKLAEGNGIFPRLAGQRAAYVARQLDVIQKRFRDSPVMHGVVKDLNQDDMKAVGEYVQSL
jgi:cytochrome c553